MHSVCSQEHDLKAHAITMRRNGLDISEATGSMIYITCLSDAYSCLFHKTMPISHGRILKGTIHAIRASMTVLRFGAVLHGTMQLIIHGRHSFTYKSKRALHTCGSCSNSFCSAGASSPVDSSTTASKQMAWRLNRPPILPSCKTACIWVIEYLGNDCIEIVEKGILAARMNTLLCAWPDAASILLSCPAARQCRRFPISCHFGCEGEQKQRQR